ncbi:hypothetical protein F8S13_21915 [Chloroflexia bacterium SDU3-3]|nr:hypothetical protein F8S13_21915 [Chloroflexia bacterium SDU3-3]
MANPEPQLPLWRRWASYFFYAWGLSMTQWGLFTHERGFFGLARGSFGRALGLRPSFAAAYLRRGVLLCRELGEVAVGLEDLDRAVACAPEWGEAYLQRGLVRRFHGDPQQAAADLERFLALEPGSPWGGEAANQLAQLRQVTQEQ